MLEDSLPVIAAKAPKTQFKTNSTLIFPPKKMYCPAKPIIPPPNEQHMVATVWGRTINDVIFSTHAAVTVCMHILADLEFVKKTAKVGWLLLDGWQNSIPPILYICFNFLFLLVFIFSYFDLTSPVSCELGCFHFGWYSVKAIGYGLIDCGFFIYLSQKEQNIESSSVSCPAKANQV